MTWPAGIHPFYLSDREWHDETGGRLCGGCGNDVDSCHPGHPCGDVEPVFPDPIHQSTARVCDRCPTRVATGQIRAVRGHYRKAAE